MTEAAAAARYGAGGSSVTVTVNSVKEVLEEGVLLEIGTNILTEEELAAMEESRLRAQEQQRQQAAPPPGGVIRSHRFGGPKYEHPVQPKPTAAQKKAKAAAEKQREQVRAHDAQRAAEEAVKAKAAQALQHEQAEAARLAQEERYRAMWGFSSGPAVLSRKGSPSYKGGS